jgi:hypothetical protein
MNVNAPSWVWFLVVLILILVLFFLLGHRVVIT